MRGLGLKNYFVKKKKERKKKAPQEKNWEFFLLDTQTTPSIENLTQRWTISGYFFLQYQGTFFDFQKRARRLSPLKQSHEVFYKKRYSQNFLKIYRKTPLETQSFFFKKSRCIYNFFLTKEIPTQAFSCQHSKIFKNIFFFRTPLDSYF